MEGGHKGGRKRKKSSRGKVSRMIVCVCVYMNAYVYIW